MGYYPLPIIYYIIMGITQFIYPWVTHILWLYITKFPEVLPCDPTVVSRVTWTWLGFWGSNSLCGVLEHRQQFCFAPHLGEAARISQDRW